MLATKTALVTGSTGFIGRATVSDLENAGWKVTKGVRSSNEAIADGSILVDLSEPATILAIAKDLRFDAIVHLGARVGWAGAAESEMFIPNVLSTGCLAYLANHWDAQMIFASTAIVHGIRKEIIDIDSKVLPDTVYANSKWLGEQLLVAAHTHHCILRIAGVFGCGGPAHLGLNHAIDGALKGKAPIQIGMGGALRNYVYVKDVAQAIAYVLQERIEGTHLLAGSEVIPVREMLQVICDTLLPGQHPVTKEGPEAMNQIIKPSPCLPMTRGFREALVDIREGSL